MKASALQNFLEEDPRIEINEIQSEMNSLSINATINGPAIDIDEKYEISIDSNRDGIKMYVQGNEGYIEAKNTVAQLQELLDGIIEKGLENDDNKSIHMDDSHKVFINGIEQKIEGSNKRNKKSPLPPPSPTLMDACANPTK